MNEHQHETLTVDELRKILKIGSNSAYNLIHSREFPVKRVGRSYQIPREPFYVWLGLQNEQAATP